MEFIRTLREKSQTKRQEEIQKLAEEMITLSDFESDLYIAYAGTPLMPVKEEWTSKEIVQELSKIRQNFINSKLKSC
jgi:hypothetical protein